MSSPWDDWVPRDACRLPTVEQPLRVAEFDELFARSLRRVERPGPGLLRLTLKRYPGLTDAVEDLVSRESSCCSFFSFDVRADPGAIVVDVGVPGTRLEVLDGLEARARGHLPSR